MATMSKAIVFTEYGDPDVLRLLEVPTPEPGPGQVRVRMKAAGVQPADTRSRSGAWQAWMPVRFPARLGNEGAGVIDAVGPGVAGFAVGDEVLGPAAGAYAESVLFQADQIAAKPAIMPWIEAGALSASGQTAHTALEDLGVAAGDTVLIHAAAGGVGHIAVQLARLRGALVVATASPENHEFLRSLGALPVAYGPGLVDRIKEVAPAGVDAALDGAGGEALEVSLEVVGKRDRIGTIADQGGAARLGLRSIGTRRSADRLGELLRLYSEGQLRVAVWKEFPLAQAAAAHRESERGHLRGKIVLTM
ncbi:Alcohol dehydrogenase zinc-binding domain protein [Catenulispora acidiphila DSM 44928]|uniref:Alcohol dehydrogenase zinc-binding domain protein n=1 Tax=Catenulispora acidiphila (strain DSM 44928 / JCM 14897 / NBRC 102108 / NRRL B-24433 / ID139908) TaxID=479433 RepID=C7PY56_CATAD|nr:Alcohol dehydrogenase zinc-binding domain protein [Catenulispora acidiphila DSM 44928]